MTMTTLRNFFACIALGACGEVKLEQRSADFDLSGPIVVGDVKIVGVAVVEVEIDTSALVEMTCDRGQVEVTGGVSPAVLTCGASVQIDLAAGQATLYLLARETVRPASATVTW